MNLGTLLEMATSADPDRVALSSCDGSLTYAQVQQRASRIAATLRDLGGERVALLDVNSAVTPLMLFATAAAGLPLAPMNFRLTDDQLRAAIARLAPVSVVAGRDYLGCVPVTDDVDVVESTELLARSVEDEKEGIWPTEFADPNGVAVVLATSGTSGRPKEALLRHSHLVNYILGTVDFWSADNDEAILVSMPNYHIACITSMLSSVYSGRRIVLLPQFSADAWVEVAAAQRVTHAMLVPTMLTRVLDVLESRGITLPALRQLSYGGGRMPRLTIERALRLLPKVGFTNAYGLTETSSTISLLTPDDHREAVAASDPVVRARLGSVGRAVPGVELEIRDADGTPIRNGASGEVYVRGPQVSGEYRSHSALDEQGWYRTRDRGRLDVDGYLYVDGRMDDVIVRGGENLSPGEIEDAAIAHPAVCAAAAVGVPDIEWGERVEILVVLEPGASLSDGELQDWMRERLRSAKVPSRVHVRDALPYSDTGKLLRRVLIEELGHAARG